MLVHFHMLELLCRFEKKYVSVYMIHTSQLCGAPKKSILQKFIVSHSSHLHFCFVAASWGREPACSVLRTALFLSENWTASVFAKAISLFCPKHCLASCVGYSILTSFWQSWSLTSPPFLFSTLPTKCSGNFSKRR